MKANNKKNINIREVAVRLWKKKRMLLRNMIIGGVVAAALIVCVPRYYVCEVTLAPEFGNAASGGSLAALAGSFGVSLSNGAGDDAISPSLYPDLIQSKAFLVSLFPVEVKTQDGKIHTDYYTYLDKYQKHAWWTTATNAVKRTFSNLFSKKQDEAQSHSRQPNPFRLSKKDYRMAEGISRKIGCSVDRTNYVISITVTDQDPLVAATMADSIRTRLQAFITNYRTSKARVDVAYYQKLTDKARQDYQKIVNAYSAYADSHRDMIMQSYISERDELENDMQNALTIYTGMNQQLQNAKAKVQENTPAFTTLKCASVPILPAGPKRVMFVLAVMVLVMVVSSLWVLKKNSLSPKKSGNKAAEVANAGDDKTDDEGETTLQQENEQSDDDSTDNNPSS